MIEVSDSEDDNDFEVIESEVIESEVIESKLIKSEVNPEINPKDLDDGI